MNLIFYIFKPINKKSSSKNNNLIDNQKLYFWHFNKLLAHLQEKLTDNKYIYLLLTR